MNKSDSIAAIAKALVQAQAELRNPKFDSANPHFRNKYASLAEVRDTVTPALAAHGISIHQLLGRSDIGIACETILLHESGEWIGSTIELPIIKNDPQAYGSAYSYARRYALMAIVNVVGDDDDDANEASRPSGRQVSAESIERSYKQHMANIEAASNLIELKRAWNAAAHWAEPHPGILAVLTSAKDSRKSALEQTEEAAA